MRHGCAHRLSDSGAPTCYVTDMVRTLELAISKAASLPEAAQEQLGRELGITKERVRQIESRAQDKLRKIAGEEGLKERFADLLALVHRVLPGPPPARPQGLCAARPRGRMHRQGQGASPL